MRSEVVLLVCCLVLPALAGPLQSVISRLETHSGSCVILDASVSRDCHGLVEAAVGTSCPVKTSNNAMAQYTCHDSGLWIERNAGTMIHRRREKRFFGFVAAAVIACFFLCGGGSSPPPNSPPSIRCPPSSTVYAERGKTTAVVTWSPPSASDAEDSDLSSKVQKTAGVEMNSEQSAGDYSIQYEVRDSGNAMAYCSFTVKVAVRRCYPLQYPLHGSLSCSPSRTLWGSQCQLSCDQGYEVQGPHVFQCEETEIWTPSDRPQCEPRECVTLPSVDHGFFTCLGGQQYRSLCLLGCEAGYVARGSVIACQADGTFTTPGQCADNTQPQFPTGCPPDVEAIAERPGQLTEVTWSAPTATDNSGNVTVTSTSSPGDGYPLGVTSVVYTATDAEGNMASCSFRISVTTVSCPVPAYDQSGLALMQYSCPTGYVAGSICDVTCSAGYPHLGAKQIECHLDLTTSPPSAAWSPRNGTDPECQVLSCPKLRAPANGAMACSSWSLGEICTLTCQAEYDIPRGLFSPQFVCTTNGQGWDPNVAVPDCNKVRDPNQASIPNFFYFYSGNCSDEATKATIQQLFVDILQTSRFKAACQNVPDCRADRVSVSCGDPNNGGRRRREALRQRRSTQSILVEFNVTISFTEKLEEQVQNITLVLAQEAAQGSFDLTIDGETYLARDFSSGPTLYDCPEGSEFNPVIATCAGCSRGAFYNATVDGCQDCPQGFYADQGFSLSCSPCPQHSTTKATGSRSQDDCIRLCGPGHSSPSGLELCQPCPAGSFQPDFGQTSCLSCPANHSTPSNASTASSSCLALDACLSRPCGQHSCQQGASLGEFLCTCQDGWSGVTCQTPPDPCQGHLCGNGATCVRTADNYTCSCPAGFYGDFCQETIVDGVYGPFGEWSQCSKTCGGGTQSRARSCDSPPPGPQGQACVGPREELLSCNVQPCPVCPSLGRPYGVQFNCTENDDVTTCVVTCREGLTFAEPPLDKYQCGRASNYSWNHQTSDFPEGRIPECSAVKTPTTAVATVTAQYGSCPNVGGGSDAVDQIRTSLQSLDCVSKNICTPDVTMTGCDAVGRKRRSTSNTGSVIVTLTLTGQGTTLDLTSLANNSLSAAALDYVTRLLSVDASAQSLSNNTNNVLTLSVGGSLLSPLTLHVSGQLFCPAGTVPTEGVCAECAKGTRQEGQGCVLCGRGFYQGHSGQTSCLACPEGKTTPSPASTQLSQCTVDAPSSGQDNPDEEASSSTLVIAVSVVACVVVLAVAVPLSIFLYKTLKSRQRVDNSCADLKDVHLRGWTPDLFVKTAFPPLSSMETKAGVPPPSTLPPPYS